MNMKQQLDTLVENQGPKVGELVILVLLTVPKDKGWSLQYAQYLRLQPESQFVTAQDLAMTV